MGPPDIAWDGQFTASEEKKYQEMPAFPRVSRNYLRKLLACATSGGELSYFILIERKKR